MLIEIAEKDLAAISNALRTWRDFPDCQPRYRGATVAVARLLQHLEETMQYLEALDRELPISDTAVAAAAVLDEEASEYSLRGQFLMMAAGSLKLPEHAHARMMAIAAGFSTSLVHGVGMPRQVLCRDSVAGVILTALKAAYKEGQGHKI